MELEPDHHQTKPNLNKPKFSEIETKEATKLKMNSAGEDLVPEPPLQAQATGEGEGNDRDTGRVRIVATQVRSIIVFTKLNFYFF